MAEIEGRAVGLISFTTEVDIAILQRCFDLGPYDELEERSHIEAAQKAAAAAAEAERVAAEARAAKAAAEAARQKKAAEAKAAEEAEAAAAAAEAEGGDGKEGGGEAVAAAEAAGGEGKEAGEGKGDEEGVESSSKEQDGGDEGGGEKQADEEDEVEEVAAVDGDNLDGFIEATGEDFEEHVAQQRLLSTPGGGGAADISTMKGRSLAFAVTLFCLDESLEAAAGDFLPDAFAAFPDKDYCLVTLPHTATETPLLANFTQIQPRSGSTFSHVLCVPNEAERRIDRETESNESTSNERRSRIHVSNTVLSHTTHTTHTINAPPPHTHSSLLLFLIVTWYTATRCSRRASPWTALSLAIEIPFRTCSPAPVSTTTPWPP